MKTKYSTGQLLGGGGHRSSTATKQQFSVLTTDFCMNALVVSFSESVSDVGNRNI